MNAKERRILTVVIISVLAAWLVLPLVLSFNEPALPISKIELLFDAAQAHRHTQEFVTQFPKRVLGSLESRQSTGYLHDALATLGYELSYSYFDARISRRKEVGRNVLGYRKGKSPEIIVLIAHLDTARSTVQGAMDNGSGVGVLLELARILAPPSNRSLLVVFSDGKEYGTLGARELAEKYPQRDKIAAVLSLDSVSTGHLSAFCLEEDGLDKGYAPPWLRRMAKDAAETQALKRPVQSSSRIGEHLERSFQLAWADQGPFLKAGIPAINLGSQSSDRSRDQAVYHSPQDTIENLQITSIERYGRAAERLARTLDEMPDVRRESSESFRLWGNRFTRPGVMRVLHAVSFLPLAVVWWFLFKNFRNRLSLTQTGRELIAFMATAIPFLIMYFAVGLFRALRQIPLYTMYPATKDPVLMNSPWAVVGTVLGAGLFVAVVAYIIAGYSLKSWPRPGFNASKLILLSLLLICVILGLWYNSYWAVTFFLLPAWIWSIAGRGRWLTAAAGLPYVILLLVYASRLELGWNFIWFHILAISNGLFTAPAVLLGIVVASIGIRFLAIQKAATDS